MKRLLIKHDLTDETITKKLKRSDGAKKKRVPFPNEHDRLYKAWLIMQIDSDLDGAMIQTHIIHRLYDMMCYIGYNKKSRQSDCESILYASITGFNSLSTPLGDLTVAFSCKTDYVVLVRETPFSRRLIAKRSTAKDRIVLQSDTGKKKCEECVTKNRQSCVECMKIVILPKNNLTLYQVYQQYNKSSKIFSSITF